MRPRILFQGSYKLGRADVSERPDAAIPIAGALGRMLISRGFDVILTGLSLLDCEVGGAAVAECERLGISPRERIRTYPYGPNTDPKKAFGMVLEPIDKRWQEVRTFVVQECDALIALIGGKGTSDCIQKTVLARKPVFPIPVAGGAAKTEWDRLRVARHFNEKGGSIEFLGDVTLGPAELAEQISIELSRLLKSRSRDPSRRIFIVHGHDAALKNQLARLLETLLFSPVILAEQAEKGQALISKLHSNLADVAYAFVLYTPDDIGAVATSPAASTPRARQNVVFEHGILFGMLGSDRICTLVKGDLEMPSDLHGIVTKVIKKDGGIEAIAVEIVKELSAAGYDVDANRLLAR